MCQQAGHGISGEILGPRKLEKDPHRSWRCKTSKTEACCLEARCISSGEALGCDHNIPILVKPINYKEPTRAQSLVLHGRLIEGDSVTSTLKVLEL